jgi:hypothetical protein
MTSVAMKSPKAICPGAKRMFKKLTFAFCPLPFDLLLQFQHRVSLATLRYQDPQPEATVEMVFRIMRRSKSMEAFCR